MAEQMRPSSPQQAPDPSDSYERSHPEHEAGMGRLDTNRNATPRNQTDHMQQAVKNQQDATRQVNAQENKQTVHNPRHSMKEEEPLGWDQAPTGSGPADAQRQPRTGGKGGTPNVGENRSNG